MNEEGIKVTARPILVLTCFCSDFSTMDRVLMFFYITLSRRALLLLCAADFELFSCCLLLGCYSAIDLVISVCNVDWKQFD